MAAPRGRRTTHVTVYLSAAEAAAWDLARSFEHGGGWAGAAPPSRAAWVMERVCMALGRWEQGDAADRRTQLAAQALDRLDEEERDICPALSKGRPTRY